MRLRSVIVLRTLVCVLLLPALLVAQASLETHPGSAENTRPLKPAQQKGKWGYIDSTGRFLIYPQFEAAGSFSEGLAPVELHKRFGYIAIDGHFAIPPKYVMAAEFKEGLALVGTRRPLTPFGTGEYGFAIFGYATYVDHLGKEIRRPFMIESASSFSEGLAAVRPGATWGGCGKAGYLNKKGEWSVKPQFNALRDFSDGLAAVNQGGDCHTGGGGKWGYIDKGGAWAIPLRFDFAGQFKHGLACVEEQAQWSLIDTMGKGTVVGKVDCLRNDDQPTVPQSER